MHVFGKNQEFHIQLKQSNSKYPDFHLQIISSSKKGFKVTCVSSRHSRKSVIFLKLMTDFSFYFSSYLLNEESMIALMSIPSQFTCVSSRHSRKYVTLLKLMTELIFFSKLLERLFFYHIFLKNFKLTSYLNR